MTPALTKLWRLSNLALLMSQPFRINLINNAMCIKVKTNYTYVAIFGISILLFFSPLWVCGKAYVQYQMTKLSLPKPQPFNIEKPIAMK